MKFIREERVRFAHCDPAGIVFFPQYLVMLNTLVEDWFDRGLKVPYADFIRRRRLGVPTVRLEVDFTAISRIGDDLSLQLAITHAGRSSLRVNAEYWCGDELRLRARQVLVCTSLDDHRPRELPDDVRAGLAPYLDTEDTP
jgi:4-hydroxybenzoyl-CoA thioesterase